MNLENINVKHLKDAIAVMQRVADNATCLFNMGYWQDFGDWESCAISERALHGCGIAACFGGWLAVSPEFQSAGGGVGDEGQPLFNGYQGCLAIAEYLGVGEIDAEALCATNADAATQFYRTIGMHLITARDVLDKLNEMLEAVYPR